MPKLYKRGDTWHYSFTVEGVRIRRSSGTSDRKLAADAAIEHERRERRAAVHGPESVLTFSEAAGLYIDAGKDTRFLLPALDHFKDTRISRITPGMVRDAAMTLYPHASGATRNRQGITPIQAVINFAAEKGLCPAIRVKRFPVEKKVRQAGDKNWLAAFQRGARENGNEDIAALARFMFETGARVGQAAALTWEDVDLSARTALLRTKKTGPGGGIWERHAHLTVTMVAELANLPKDRYRVFGYRSRSTVTRAWRRAIATAKIAPLGRHEAGRHGFGTEMIVRGKVDVPTAAEMGGWRSRRLLLETYAHPEGGKQAIDTVFGTPASQGSGKGRRKRVLGSP
jgi:integrase